MNIRKIYAALCCLLLVTMSVNAQQYMNVSGNKDSNTIPTLLVKYATLKGDKDWFKIMNGSAEAKDHSISASCTVRLATSSTIKKLATAPEIGVCYSSTNSTPTMSDDSQMLGEELGSYTFTLTSLIPGTTYCYRVYMKLGEEVFYGDVCNAKTSGARPAGPFKIINGHLFLDLGLPSGLLWAETNVGAEAAADDGNYYAWGETTTKDYYDWSTYKYGSSYGNITKYTVKGGNLEKTDDAAYVNWGSPCRMPTQTEFEELCNTDNCTWTWTRKINSSNRTIMGYEVTSKKNGNNIFLPASGYRNESLLDSHGSYGSYWSSTLSSIYTRGAYNLLFSSGDFGSDYYARCYGHTVRPVAKP